MEYFEGDDNKFLIYLAYLADIFGIYNTYSLRLQGPNITIIETINSMNALWACLSRWMDKVKKKDFSMFSMPNEIVREFNVPSDCLETILDHMHNLEAEISQRFDEIKYATSLAWVIDPFLASPEDVSYISNTSEEVLIGLQMSTHAKQIFDKKGYICFWIESASKMAKTLSCITMK